MIDIRDVHKDLKDKKVLNDLTINFKEQNAYLLKGHNGSGKTMLLRLVCGLINPSKGKVTYNKNYRFGIIIETPQFLNNETAFYNLKFLASINKIIGDEEIVQVLKRLNLYESKDKKVKSFSLGMKQRLAVCQAIMENPDVLLLDEPFNAIDDDNIKVVLEIIDEYKQEGKLVIVAAHGLNDADVQVFDKVITLQNGAIQGITKVNAM
ncbi:ABC-2 type transport system ATP-binding protein [Natronobacillus azotifigens]|uniref:ATP-binding cassette domain-containing protein n=1 Tax=Natronobacillus azotifigens TaxID=472978 RepID=A0A9J6RAB4_9BACI|nr:ATP-binding cassette domain-containing protein [Natronobacillus azotifigens]MCZ0702259.1 ATP-binding cassette domain-containing protein [Natronobacillus azotifigens]